MKKIASIALIALILLNVMGYYGVFIGLKYQNNQRMSERLDADIYSGSEAVTIEIPITIPYASESSEYQRVDGEFEHQGETYRMVKQRISNGTLFLVCVKDVKGNRINQALKDYVKTFADNPTDSKAPSKSHISLIKDYVTTSYYSIDNFSEGWTSVIRNQTRPSVFIDAFSASIAHPPERG